LNTVITAHNERTAVTSDAARETLPAAEHSPDRPEMRKPAHRPVRPLAAAGDLLRALAAPVRIAIVLELRESDRCVHELVDALDVAQPLISQHLRVLKAAGVVRGDRNGREVVYRLVDEHLAHIVVDAVAHAEEAVGIRRGLDGDPKGADR
jgi:ArsR family transcriptional regulator, zinc-responsive transcriptional repressor